MDQQDSEDMSFFDLDDWPVPGLSLTPVRPEKQTPQVCPQPEMPTIPETMAMNEQGSMPSHQYDLYKQQTPLVPGALLSTIALNEGNIDPEPESFDYMLDFSNIDEFDEGEGDVDVDGSIGDYQPSTMDTPSMDQRPLTSSSHSSAVGRLYPGIHAQMARERAESSQRLQFSPSRQVQQQLVSGPQGSVSSPQQPMYLLHSPASEAAVTQETISQLLVSQRAQGRTSESEEPATRIPPHKKTDREMDEDERRLRGEDGKRMTVKERRQLRNKVSARAFRNRRKAYVSDLEEELKLEKKEKLGLQAELEAAKRENEALKQENARLLSCVEYVTSQGLPTLHPYQQQPGQYPPGPPGGFDFNNYMPPPGKPT